MKSLLFRLILVVATSTALQAQAEVRGFWADAFHSGYKSVGEIQDLILRAQQGNFNALFVEVLAYHDNVGGGHGAYWNSAIVPKATDIIGGIDPLAVLCQQAHAVGLEVHAWIIPYRASTSWPPGGNSTLAAHPEWLMVPQANMGQGPATVGPFYTLDPGSPEVQDYLIDITREIVEGYPVDGLNLDYIRYIQTDAGYPSNTSYADSGLERYRRITGATGTPSPGSSAWSDFRRRTIDEFVRRCRAEIPAMRSNPQQPVRLSADLIAFGDAPASFNAGSAYQLFQNWRWWMEQGWLDTGIPMNYKREHCSSQASWYRNWVQAALGWRYGRHLLMGQGNYLNGFSQSVSQLAYARNAGVDGVLTFSYWATRSQNTLCDNNDVVVNDWSWYPYLGTNLFTFPTPTPRMDWRDRTRASEGTLWGRVVDGFTGQPVEDATIQVGGLPSVQTDGNGYYAVTLVPANSGGRLYPVSATKSGYGGFLHNAAIVVAGENNRYDLDLDSIQYRLQVGTLFSEASGSFRVENATPFLTQYLLYSRFGPGRTWFPPLSLWVDLDRPKVAATTTADNQGVATWVLNLPRKARGLNVALQVAESGRVTNLIQTAVH